MNKVLIIDDEDQLRGLLSRIIGLEGYEVFQADSCKNGLKQLALHDPDVVLCDVRLPDGNGVELIAEIKRVKPLAEVIMLTAHGNIPDGVQAIKNGAFDYLTKGDDNNRIIPLISRAMDQVAKAKQESQAEILVDREYSFDTILGSSMAIREAIALAKKVSVTDVPVLLTGETGTGKEVFAQAIHRNSERAKKSFVAVNCAAFSKELLESEMFGHKAGSFTGALKDKKGLFEEANHGTIFLDEIGEMAFDLQAKLLRILEAGEFIKIGDTKPTKVDVRVIAATNRDLRQLAGQGRFREDLFYRLNAFPLRIPALRERGDAALLLARLFARKFSVAAKGRLLPLTEDAAAHLAAYGWPGNVRELENCIQLHVNLAEGDAINIPPLAPEHQEATVPIEGFSTQKNVFEKKLIAEALERYGGNVKKTASFLHIPLSTLYNKIKRYNLFPQRLKAPEPTDTHEQDKELGMLVSRLSPQSKESLRLFLKTLV